MPQALARLCTTTRNRGNPPIGGGAFSLRGIGASSGGVLFTPEGFQHGRLNPKLLVLVTYQVEKATAKGPIRKGGIRLIRELTSAHSSSMSGRVVLCSGACRKG